jgi:hypothetical protein
MVHFVIFREAIELLGIVRRLKGLAIVCPTMVDAVANGTVAGTPLETFLRVDAVTPVGMVIGHYATALVNPPALSVACP